MYNFEDEAKKEIEALPDDINNNKNEFKSWLIDRYGKTGTPSSYINSIGILNEKCLEM